MAKHGACCLSSINLSEFVNNPYTDSAFFDMESFTKAVQVGIRTLDKLIDENYKRHPLVEQQEMSYNYRNIGLGVFGYASMLIKMGMTYGSAEANDFSDKLFYTMFRAAVFESNKLAQALGKFPKYNDCVWDSDIIRAHFSNEEIESMKPYGLRNCSLLSIAPSGSISTFLGESGGIEPEFAIKYTRKTVSMDKGEEKYYEVFCNRAKEYMEIYSTNKLPNYFISSQEIPYMNRVITQAIIQQHIDTAISSTVNLPQEATKMDVANIYLSAWQSGCKGITIFRNGCKKIGILTTDDQTNEKVANLSRGEWKQKPDDTLYYLRKLRIGCGDLKLFIGWSGSEQKIQDLYVIKSGEGGCERLEQSTAITMSAILRLGGTLENIEKAFRGVGTCSSFANARAKGKKLSRGNSCGMVIFNAMKDFEAEMLGKSKTVTSPIPNSETAKNVSSNKKQSTNNFTSEKCPECGGELRYEGGCVQCPECGWSKCN